MIKPIGFIPVLTSLAGSALTAQNWQEAGVSVAACSVASLLIKPGYDFLMSLPDIKTYFGWQGELVLNAGTLLKDKNGVYSLRSPYDGSRIVVTPDELMSLIKKLKPTYFIPPPEDEAIWQSIDVIPGECNPRLLSCDYAKECLEFSDLSIYMKKGITRIADIPARDAYEGRVYKDGEVVSIMDAQFKHQYQPIDADCQCPTCQQKFTLAYLHHLFEHTPLLCQRFLIQHNVYYCQNMFKSPLK